MPLTEKGSKIKSAMEEQYGPEKGEQVFYASKNAGRISGVDMAKDQNAPASSSVSSSAVMPSGTGNTASGSIMDEETRDVPIPVGDEDIVGDIPKEKAEAPKDKSTLPDVQGASPTVSKGLAPVTVMPLSIPVGDQSLPNMNARNRDFWRR